MNKSIKFWISGIIFSIILLVILPITIYLWALPKFVSSSLFLDIVQKTVKELCTAELLLEKPVLKTSLNLSIAFSADNILLTKNGQTLFNVKKLDSGVSFNKIFKKQIILNKLGADDIYVDINGLQKMTFKQGDGSKKPMDIKVRWFNASLYLKKCTILYRNEDDVLIKLLAKELEITKTKNPKYIHFSILTDIEYDDQRFRLLFKDFDSIYFKNKKINIDNFKFIVGNSMVNVNGYLDRDNNFDIDISSKNFKIKNIQSILDSNLIIANGKDILSCFKDLDGDFDFNFNVKNSSMNGNVKANRISSKLVPLANIPFVLTNGLIEIGSKDIQIKDMKGYYGKNSSNQIEMYGDVKDYAKTAKTTLFVTGDAKDELAQYVSKIAGCKLNLKGISKLGLKVEADVNGRVDVSGGFKVPKGADFLIENASISPVKFDRAIGLKLNLVKNILDIEHINYYISDVISEKGRPVEKPLVSVSSNVDIVTGQINKLAFDIPEKLPSEFFNVLINQRIFRNGTFSGKLDYINFDKKHPYINSNVKFSDVRIVGQGLSIKNCTIKSNNKTDVNIVADGRFRRTNYTFNGSIQNKMLFPVIVKDVELNLDDLDVERLLASFAPRPQMTEEQRKQFLARMKARQIQTEKSDVPLKYFEVDKKVEEPKNEEQNVEDSDEPIVFMPNLVAIRNCRFNLDKGKYKLINFGNLNANLTLTESGILEIKSNKFDFADGISTLKVYCDMVKQNYNIRLGAKDVNADAIATSTLNLPREIDGKASALLEFFTDEKMKLNGKIQFSIDDGSITKLGLVQYILNMASIFRNPIAMVSPSTLIDLVNVPDGTFKKISGDLKIKDNVIERMIIKSSSPQLSALIFGQINLENFDSSLRIYTKFSGKDKGIAGFLRNFSLNSLSRKNQLNSEEISYYASELSLLPKLETGEDSAQVFLTTVDGDVQTTNFISSLKKIK